MAQLLSRRPGIIQPRGFVRPNLKYGRPLFLTLGTIADAHDIAQGWVSSQKPRITAGNPSGFNIAADSTRVPTYTMPDGIMTGDLTVVTQFMTTNTSAGWQDIFAKRDISQHTEFAANFNYSGGVFQSYYTHSGTFATLSIGTSAAILVSNVPATFVFRRKAIPSNFELAAWQFGHVIAQANQGNFAPDSVSDAFRLGNTPGSTALTGTIYLTAVYPWAIPDATCAWLSLNPYDVVRPALTKIGSVIAGGSSFNKSVLVTCTSSVGWTKAVGKILPITATSTTAAPIKSVGKIVPITGTTTTSWLKSVGKIVPISSTTTTSWRKSVGKLLSIASTTATVVSAIKVKLQTILVTCTSTTAFGAKTVGKIVAVASTSTTAFGSRTIGKIVAVVATSTMTLKRAVTHTILVTCTSALALLKSVGKKIATITSTTTTSVIATFSGFVARRRINLTIFRK
jgi:hypothetical protein